LLRCFSVKQEIVHSVLEFKKNGYDDLDINRIPGSRSPLRILELETEGTGIMEKPKQIKKDGCMKTGPE
jgi:hypothetical protein